MSIFENSNKIDPSFLTVAWLFFSLLAVGTAMIGYDAKGVGILSWFICLGGIVTACLVKII